MVGRIVLTIMLLVGLAFFVPLHALAQESADESKFSITPYLWLPSMDGELNFGPSPSGGGSAAMNTNEGSAFGEEDFIGERSTVSSDDFNLASGPINIAAADLNAVTGKSEEELATSGKAVQREAEASEDPMVKHELKSMKEPEQAATRDHLVSVYGSFRLRLRSTDSDDVKLTDDGSRFGVDGHYQLSPKLKVFGRAELGYNLLGNVDSLINSKSGVPEGREGDNFFERLLYVGLESPGYFLVLGKN
jgi:hypothetical protein